MSLQEKWLTAVDKNNSVLCAGLDLPEYEMGRGEEGLQKGVRKVIWSCRYLEAVLPYVAAIKINSQYWKGVGDLTALDDIFCQLDNIKDIVIIDDSKLADIGSSNDAGLYHSHKRGFDAVTLAPFAGNLEEVAQQALDRGIGAITMCLMSNPQYSRRKEELVPLLSNEVEDYYGEDIIRILERTYVKQYLYLAHDAQEFGLDGIVIGAPSGKNHIKEEEIERISRYVDEDMLVLLPGVGAQGGEAPSIWKYFGKDRVIVNVSRALMFPNGYNSEPEEQANAAKHYQEMLNKLRSS